MNEWVACLGSLGAGYVAADGPLVGRGVWEWVVPMGNLAIQSILSIPPESRRKMEITSSQLTHSRSRNRPSRLVFVSFYPLHSLLLAHISLSPRRAHGTPRPPQPPSSFLQSAFLLDNLFLFFDPHNMTPSDRAKLSLALFLPFMIFLFRFYGNSNGVSFSQLAMPIRLVFPRILGMERLLHTRRRLD
jgi:hypothetical protein